MLKPWVVTLLQFTYQGGLILMLTGCLSHTLWKDRSSRWLRILIGLAWCVMALTGWYFGFVYTTLVYSLLCTTIMRLLAANSFVKTVLVFPLLLVPFFIHPFIHHVLKEHDVIYEKRLDDEHICRAYRTWADSLSLTNLTLQREIKYSLNNEVVGSTMGTESCASCELVGARAVELAVYRCGESIGPKVVVPLPATATGARPGHSRFTPREE